MLGQLELPLLELGLEVGQLLFARRHLGQASVEVFGGSLTRRQRDRALVQLCESVEVLSRGVSRRLGHNMFPWRDYFESGRSGRGRLGGSAARRRRLAPVELSA